MISKSSKNLRFATTALLLILSLSSWSWAAEKNSEWRKRIPKQTAFEVVLNTDDGMYFDQQTIKVPVGRPIAVHLKHKGKMSKKMMGHNFVLLKKGTDIEAFGEAAASAKKTDFIPETHKSQVLAHTALIGAGETTSVTFTLKQAGTYDYICSFPAHYTVMKGLMIAQ